MLTRPFITIGKTISLVSRILNRGNGSTWPGHIALIGNKNFIRDILAKSDIKVIVVAGTNGKTTTSSLIATSLEKNGKSVLKNASGANLLNGVASTLLLNADENGRIPHDYAIFEVDENALPQVLKQLEPDYLVLLNLFRDQLDRYGEINIIADKWRDSLASLTLRTKLVLNADDPQIAFLGLHHKSNAPEPPPVLFFGVESQETTHDKKQLAADSTSCPNCGTSLFFESIVFSHLGQWKCKKCGLTRPKSETIEIKNYPLTGTYNKYNTNAAFVVLKHNGLTKDEIVKSFDNFKPVFGRQETITYQGKKVQLFLSKNPTSFNQSFTTIKEQNASTILLVLNDRVPDGRDVSWIWDTDLTGIDQFKQVIVSGDRTYDMALRVKYEGQEQRQESLQIEPVLAKAITSALEKTPENETLYILPTYSAMLESRKILTGKKIL